VLRLGEGRVIPRGTIKQGRSQDYFYRGEGNFEAFRDDHEGEGGVLDEGQRAPSSPSAGYGERCKHGTGG